MGINPVLQTGLLNQSSAQVIDGSLRFDSSKSQYLRRTPTANGNTRLWTWSGWLKRTPGTLQDVFSAGQEVTNDGYYTRFRLENDSLNLRQWNASLSLDASLTSSMKLRDSSAFFHYVIIYDVDNSTNTDKVRWYINGQRVTSFSGTDYPASESWINNSTKTHTIGGHYDGGGTNADSFWNGHMSQVYFLEGQALGPEYFGFTDPLTNTWRPKKFSGNFTLSSANDGTTWSSSVSGPVNSSKPLSLLFGGTIGSGYANGTTPTSGNTLTFDISSKNLTVTNVRLNTFISTGPGGGGTPNTFTLNGTTVPIANSDGDQTHVVAVNGQLNTIAWSYDSGNGPYVYMRGIEVDLGGGLGYELLTDGVNNTGPNSFYLPMDGNSPIGQDKSGNGNNWTPVNFGGSVELDKATGALPILNTTQGGTQATVGVRTDAYASNLVLAVPFVGNTDDVSHLVNSSQSQKADTNSGSTATTTLSNFYSGSRDFDGSNDTCSFASVPACGAGDWTVEFWLYSESSAQDTVYRRIVSTGENATSAIQIGHIGSGAVSGGYITYTHSDNSVYAVNTSKVTDRWAHIAVVRESGSVNVYTDGVKGTTADSDSNNKTGTTWYISGYGGATDRGRFNGKIQDFRVYPGVAKYTSDFVVPATSPDILPDTPSGVSGSSKLAKITDGAVAFDGSGDNLAFSLASGGFGSGDFTLEYFLYQNTLTNYQTHFGVTRGVNGFNIGSQAAGNLVFYDSNGGGSVKLDTGAGGVGVKRWYHVAFVRSGTTITGYLDGASFGTYTSSVDYSATTCTVGSIESNSEYTNGIISNFRINVGTALYTSNFTPPTAPLTNVTNTKLLCCQSNTQAGAAVTAPNMGGVNNGTNWSHFLTTNAGDNFDGSGPKYYAFDGNGSNKAFTGNNSDGTTQGTSFLQVNFPSPISGALRVKCDNGNTVRNVTSGDTLLATQSSGSDNQFVDCGNVSNLSKLRVLMSGGSRPAISVVELDGTTLVDPASPVGNTAATNFNPFNTSINTVRGQETGYATLNPLAKGTAHSLSNGNLDFTMPSSGGSTTTVATMGVSSGKYYWEMEVKSTTTYYPGIGIDSNPIPTAQSGSNSTGRMYLETGAKFDNANLYAYGDQYFAGDVIAAALDMDEGTITFYRNGKSQGVAYSGITGTQFPVLVGHNGPTGSMNYGQKPFKFPPPDGFQPLNAANVRPETVISRPDKYVAVTTYSGNGGTKDIVVGHKPDFVWVKARDGSARSHFLYDSVRGEELFLQTDGTAGQSALQTNTLSSFNDDGFTTGSRTGMNDDGVGYVTWTWKAGGNKNTFNIDDVGYANASDVNMNVGALNSSAYDTSDTWSDDLSSPNGAYNNSPITNAFNGSLSNGFESGNPSGNYSTIRFQPATPITVNTQIRIYVFDLNDSNVTYQYRVNDGSWTSMPGTSSPYLRWQDLGFTGTLTSFEYRSNTSITYKPTLYAVEIDGKRLVDSGTDLSGLTQYPSIASTGCSVGTKQGFSIIKYTGNGSAATIPHGLSQTPTFIIKKFVGGTSNWDVWTPFLSANNRLLLNTTGYDGQNATTSYQSVNTATFDVHAGNNDDTVDMIAYLWHDVPGLQKFGTYEGTGVAGNYVHLGFRPALIWIKNLDNTSINNWGIIDSTRSYANVGNHTLATNLSNAESYFGDGSSVFGANNKIDLLSDGFTLRETSGFGNASGITFLYCAWAEAPSFNLYGAQSNAR